MKNKFGWRSCLALLLAFAMTAVSCKDDDEAVSEQLSVSQSQLSVNKSGLTYDGAETTVEITADAFWLATIPQAADWITVAPMAADGSAPVSVTAAPNTGSARSAELVFETRRGTRTILTVRQGAGDEQTVYMQETLGTGASAVPIADFEAWQVTGIGVAGIAHAGIGVLIDSEMSSAGYDGASGGNNVLFPEAGSEFIIGPVALRDAMDFRLRFGVSFSAGTDARNFHVQAGLNKSDWTTLPCSFASAAGWTEVLSEFYVNEVDALYFRFVSEDPGVRIDDISLVEGLPGEGELLEFSSYADDGKEPGYVYFEDRFDWDDASFGGTDFIGNPTVGGSETRFDLVKDEKLKEILANSGWTMAADQPYAYLRLGYLKMGKTLMAGAVLTPKFEKIAAGTSADLIVTFDATVQEYKGVKDLDGLIVEAVGGGTVNGDTSTSARIDTESWNTWRTLSVVIRKATSKTQLRFGCAWADADMKVQNKSNRFYLDNVKVVKAPQAEE